MQSVEESVFIEEIFNYSNSNNKDVYNLLGVNNWSSEYGSLLGKALEKTSIADDDSPACFDFEQWVSSNLAFERTDDVVQPLVISEELTPLDGSTTTSGLCTRQKRHRTRTCGKNKEEIEKQRMAHIAAERDRRKQMNAYLTQLKQLMPESYVQKNDQASIVGGAINYVKDLEKQQHFWSGQKQSKQNIVSNVAFDHQGSSSSNSPFSEFFTFPQYSSSSTTAATHDDQYFYHNNVAMAATMIDHGLTLIPRPAADDIEVTMVESHASLKIRSKRQRLKQKLLQIVNGLQNLGLTILHLNVTTVDQFVLYSISVKVEDDCKLTSGDGIATAINQMLESFK